MNYYNEVITSHLNIDSIYFGKIKVECMKNVFLPVCVIFIRKSHCSRPWRQCVERYCKMCVNNVYIFINVFFLDVTVPSRRRKRVPIVEECCENTCTPYHLKAYCWENQRYVSNLTYGNIILRVWRFIDLKTLINQYDFVYVYKYTY